MIDPLPGNWVGEADCVLVGHRSIVNQVRFNSHSMYLLSSGVEKVIKVTGPVLPFRVTSFSSHRSCCFVSSCGAHLP